ncbi:hypothetical protein JCM8547_006264 [Rhodosporidiobolus lusitaniae]
MSTPFTFTQQALSSPAVLAALFDIFSETSSPAYLDGILTARKHLVLFARVCKAWAGAAQRTLPAELVFAGQGKEGGTKEMLRWLEWEEEREKYPTKHLVFNDELPFIVRGNGRDKWSWAVVEDVLERVERVDHLYLKFDHQPSLPSHLLEVLNLRSLTALTLASPLYLPPDHPPLNLPFRLREFTIIDVSLHPPFTPRRTWFTTLSALLLHPSQLGHLRILNFSGLTSYLFYLKLLFPIASSLLEFRIPAIPGRPEKPHPQVWQLMFFAALCKNLRHLHIGHVQDLTPQILVFFPEGTVPRVTFTLLEGRVGHGIPHLVNPEFVEELDSWKILTEVLEKREGLKVVAIERGRLLAPFQARKLAEVVARKKMHFQIDEFDCELSLDDYGKLRELFQKTDHSLVLQGEFLAGKAWPDDLGRQHGTGLGIEF